MSESLHHVKSLVYSNTTLWYYDVHKPVVIQVDISKCGLGAALLQNGKTVPFASKAIIQVK